MDSISDFKFLEIKELRDIVELPQDNEMRKQEGHTYSKRYKFELSNLVGAPDNANTK